jgi:hypothetical protein
VFNEKTTAVTNVIASINLKQNVSVPEELNSWVCFITESMVTEAQSGYEYSMTTGLLNATLEGTTIFPLGFESRIYKSYCDVNPLPEIKV